MSKRRQTIEDFLRLREYDTAQRLLEQLTKRLLKNPPTHLNQLVWPVEQLAILYRKKKDYTREIELLKAYVAVVGPNPLHRYEQYLVERLVKAHELAARHVPDRGMCEMCEALDRKLTRIESGHLVCETCRRTFLPPPRKKHWATLNDIAFLRCYGFEVADDLPKLEAKRLYRIHKARCNGFELDITASDAEIEDALASIVETFESRVSGVTHPNLDGTSRQEAIRLCSIGDEVVLIRDPANPFDPLAVRVCRMQGEQIGYLPAVVVRDDWDGGMNIAAQMDNGIPFTATIIEIDQFEFRNGLYWGVELSVKYYPFLRMEL